MSFDLTADHIKLLRHSYVDRELSTWETGAAMIDPKRPYGNSNVAGDIAELLHLPMPTDPDDDMPDSTYERAMQIHRETPTALQIVLQTGEFIPGIYRRRNTYDARSWERV